MVFESHRLLVQKIHFSEVGAVLSPERDIVFLIIHTPSSQPQQKGSGFTLDGMGSVRYQWKRSEHDENRADT